MGRAGWWLMVLFGQWGLEGLLRLYGYLYLLSGLLPFLCIFIHY